MFRPEQLHSQMLVVPCVEKDSVFLLSGESDCDVGGGSNVEGLQLDVGGVGVEAEGGQILASLAGVPRGTLAHVVVGPRRLKSNQLYDTRGHGKLRLSFMMKLKILKEFTFF